MLPARFLRRTEKPSPENQSQRPWLVEPQAHLEQLDCAHNQDSGKFNSELATPTRHVYSNKLQKKNRVPAIHTETQLKNDTPKNAGLVLAMRRTSAVAHTPQVALHFPFPLHDLPSPRTCTVIGLEVHRGLVVHTFRIPLLPLDRFLYKYSYILPDV